MIKSAFTLTRGGGPGLKSGDFERIYFLNGTLIKFYNSEHGLLNRDDLPCCRKQDKTNRPVQTDHFSHTIKFLFDLPRILCIILIRRNGRFHLYI